MAGMSARPENRTVPRVLSQIYANFQEGQRGRWIGQSNLVFELRLIDSGSEIEQDVPFVLRC